MDYENVLGEHKFPTYEELKNGLLRLIDEGKISREDAARVLPALESEKPMNLEEEINRYLQEECSGDDEPSISEIARHFAQWGAEHLANSSDEVVINGHKVEYDKDKNAITMWEIPNDLEEAADEYAEKHGFRVPYDGSDNFYDDVDVKASKEGFIAGYNR